MKQYLPYIYAVVFLGIFSGSLMSMFDLKAMTYTIPFMTFFWAGMLTPMLNK